jgi:hypothetical protein
MSGDGGSIMGVSGSGCPGTYGGGGLSGSLANFQVYNTSLSQTEISALYQEGIGGAPIRPQNVTAWWPMNGNLDDYSGNNNNAQIYNGVKFSSSWTSGYTQP